MLFYGTWLDLLVIVFLGIILIFIIRNYTIPKIKNRKIILSIIFAAISLLLLLMVILTSIEYIADRKDYRESLNYYTSQAEEDINNDLVEFEYFGFPDRRIIKEENFSKIDSIAKGFGVKLIPVSDLYDGPLIEKAKDKYDEITNSYLDKRNGIGWRKRDLDEEGSHTLILEHMFSPNKPYHT